MGGWGGRGEGCPWAQLEPASVRLEAVLARLGDRLGALLGACLERPEGRMSVEAPKPAGRPKTFEK